MTLATGFGFRQLPRKTSSSLRWKCVFDPSEDGTFRGNIFTLAMVQAGGFEEGTEFLNVRTGERRVWKGQRLIPAKQDSA